MYLLLYIKKETTLAQALDCYFNLLAYIDCNSTMTRGKKSDTTFKTEKSSRNSKKENTSMNWTKNNSRGYLDPSSAVAYFSEAS